jgi:DNA-binding NarL/FixJ family response regulator
MVALGSPKRIASHLAANSNIAPHEKLSDREYQVMCMIASGKAVGEIARELCLSEKTISTHRTRLLDKMSMKTNAQLTCYAIQNNLLDRFLWRSRRNSCRVGEFKSVLT